MGDMTRRRRILTWVLGGCLVLALFLPALRKNWQLPYLEFRMGRELSKLRQTVAPWPNVHAYVGEESGAFYGGIKGVVDSDAQLRELQRAVSESGRPYKVFWFVALRTNQTRLP